MRSPNTRPLINTTRIQTTCIVVLAGLGLALSPAVAGAASPLATAQAQAANAVFLAYAPPPAGGPRALCLVDTGVNAVPDTAPGLVSATALDGGTGNDVDPLMHGTIDAAVAGGAGHGVLGAWPQLKIVSVRATDVPSPGQSPKFQYDDYVNGINQCSRTQAGPQIAVIDLPLASKILPTPDQAEEFNNAVTQAQTKGISILAAAGNDSPDIQLPGNQPGVMPVGAGDENNAICPLSPTNGLTFYAPGCYIDQIDRNGEAFCCGNGTSQASAFAAGVLVALRSYAPDLSAAKAVELLLSTTHNGHLDVAAAFQAVGLSAIVDAGVAAIPQPPAPPVTASSRPGLAAPSVRRVTWHRGVLQITLKRIPKGARLHATITFAHRNAKHLATRSRRLRARTPAPIRALLRLTRGAASSATVPIKVTRLRR
jgi:hypothetical protein